ncbi:M15 family metallopeptidase [Gudongella sp. SC589]|uniref:M15 family metallopeptidase n=1 Tax=Gudongella sp. SC589 TaxID=3385990 RepID=UPI003904CD89
MKKYLSKFVFAIIVVAVVTVNLIYGSAVQQNEMKSSEEVPTTERSLPEPFSEKEVEAMEASTMEEENMDSLEVENVDSPEVKNVDSLEDVLDHELVSIEKYSYIKTSNYFKFNKISVFSEEGSEDIYANSDDVYIKAGTLRKLIKVDDQLKDQGYNLVVWVGYRDEKLQQQLREHLAITMGITEGRYDLVAAPGMSNHQKGTAVDVTVERMDGEPLEMPSAYLDFTDNRLPSLHENNEALKVLQEAMEANGMEVYKGEWWHFNDSNREYLEGQ